MTADSDAVVWWLRKCANELSGGRNSREGRFRFKRFKLASWLMLQDLSEDSADRPADRDRVLVKRLRGYHRVSSPFLDWFSEATRNFPLDVSVVNPPLPGALNRWLLRWLLERVPGLLLWIKCHRLCPGAYGWFLRQRYLSPADPGKFLGWAERLTIGQRRSESADQLDKLLVNAFLEDLRREYRRWPARMWRRWRTTYPVLLLDDANHGNGGYRLLSLVNDIRNETAKFDPVLIISAGPGPDMASAAMARVRAEVSATVAPGGTGYQAEQACEAYENWRNNVVKRRRRRGPTTWYLPITIPVGDDPGARPSLENAECRLTAPRSPLRTIRAIYACGLVLVLLAVALGYRGWWQSHCGTDLWPWSTSYLVAEGSECIGVTDQPDVFRDPDPAHDLRSASLDQIMNQVELTVRNQNIQAEQIHADEPSRPYVTVVYLAILDSATPSPFRLVDEREAIEGIAVAQSEALTNDAGPLLRVLFANGGTTMNHGTEAAKLIIEKARHDPTVIAVVGLDQSRQNTINTIARLARAGIPSVASSLSADELTDHGSPLYFQASPRNRREAIVMARFASLKLAAGHHPKITRYLTLLSSRQRGDVYSANLAQDVKHQFRLRGFHVRSRTFAPNSSYAAGAQACADRRGLVVYAGRAVDFQNFLQGVNFHCATSPPAILADDDITGYIANPILRGSYTTIPYYYMSFAFPAGKDICRVKGFYEQLGQLFPFECDPKQGRSLDGHAALAYDATEIVLEAVRRLQDSSVPISPATIWRDLSDISYAGGASGRIDFGGRVDQHYPLDKEIAILQSPRSSSAPPTLVGACGRLTGGKQKRWCPAPGQRRAD